MDEPLRWSAPSIGDVPPAGRPTVGGIELPRGRPCPEGADRPACWCTIGPTADPVRFAGPLAAAFGQTGLWPLLWQSELPPDEFVTGDWAVEALGSVAADEVIGGLWEEWLGVPEAFDVAPYLPAFPGLAAPSREAGAIEPFAEIAQGARVGPRGPRSLLLVPCHRPADVLARIGWSFSAIHPAIIAAVLRSWEQRLAAVPVQLNPAAVTLHVGAPPRRLEDARRLVAELVVIADAAIDETVTESDRFARQLMGELAPRGRHREFSRTLWYLQLKEHPTEFLEGLLSA